MIFLGEWKDHEYRSGNDNWNNRRGRNVQSNIRDYEIDDTRVYDYEKDDDDDEQVIQILLKKLSNQKNFMYFSRFDKFFVFGFPGYF